jgi:hypothetical protein
LRPRRLRAYRIGVDLRHRPSYFPGAMVILRSARPLRNLLMGLPLLAACSSESVPAAANGDGVNDVLRACELRARWMQRAASACIDCQAAAISLACECPRFAAWGGKCRVQRDALAAEPQCSAAIDACASVCTDCACREKCYGQAAACRAKAGARDGCVAEVCAAACK